MTAPWPADRRAGARSWPARCHEALRWYVQDRRSGTITALTARRWLARRSGGIGRRHGGGQDRRWATSWSPEQLANRLPVDFPMMDPCGSSMRPSLRPVRPGPGALRRELAACLRTGRALRVPGARSQGRAKQFLSPRSRSANAPAEAADRAVPGTGKATSSSVWAARGRDPGRANHPVHHAVAPACMTGHGQPRIKNGPRSLATALRRSATRSPPRSPRCRPAAPVADLGPRRRASPRAQLRIDTGLAIAFCDPRSPGSAAATRPPMAAAPVLPKGTRPGQAQHRRLAAVAAALNSRPVRPSAGEPAEALDDLLHSGHQAGVAAAPRTRGMHLQGLYRRLCPARAALDD
jgi:hypothetical protein